MNFLIEVSHWLTKRDLDFRTTIYLHYLSWLLGGKYRDMARFVTPVTARIRELVLEDNLALPWRSSFPLTSAPLCREDRVNYFQETILIRHLSFQKAHQQNSLLKFFIIKIWSFDLNLQHSVTSL